MINRFFRMYALQIKSAFKMDYGARFKKLHQGGLVEYDPEDEDDLK